MLLVAPASVRSVQWSRRAATKRPPTSLNRPPLTASGKFPQPTFCVQHLHFLTLLLLFNRKECGHEEAEAQKRAAKAEKKRKRAEEEANRGDSDDEGMDFDFQ